MTHIGKAKKELNVFNVFMNSSPTLLCCLSQPPEGPNLFSLGMGNFLEEIDLMSVLTHSSTVVLGVSGH